jgi:multidrug efflux pump subunit AcrB
VKMQKTQRSGLSGSGVSGIRWPLFYFMSVRELLNDKAVTTMLVDNKSLDVRMGLKLDNVNKLNDISSITIQGPMGSVKLSDIAEVKEVPGSVSITTSDGRQYANVTANITEKNTGAVSQRVQEKLQSINLPEGVKTEMGGVTQMMGDTFTQMGIAMLVAVFAVFLVMMIGLGGATASLAILFSLPLAAIGSFVALFVTGIVLDAPAMIGALMLIGIVVTNAIVLIDRVQHNRSAGFSIREALMEAGKIRMRPILMTAIATIAALLPLAFGFSKGTMISQSLAVVVIGGLTTSTLLTLLIVPVAYEMLENLKTRILGHDKAAEITG